MMGKMSMAALLGATLVFVGTLSQPVGEQNPVLESRAPKSFFLPGIFHGTFFFLAAWGHDGLLFFWYVCSLPQDIFSLLSFLLSCLPLSGAAAVVSAM